MRAILAREGPNPSKTSQFLDKNNIKYKILIIHISKHKQKQMKKEYTQPELYVENVVVENGIAMSWGEAGFAGQDGIYDEYDGEL